MPAYPESTWEAERALGSLDGLDDLRMVPQDAYDKDLPDPWHGVTSTTRIRHELGYRPLVPSVWTAREAGVL